MAFTAEKFDGQTVKSLKKLVAKQIGVPRFRQRWLSEDHSELKDDAFVSASNVQLVVLDFVQADDEEVEELLDACSCNLLEQVDELLRKPLNPNVVDEHNLTALHHAAGLGNVECAALLLEAGANKDASTGGMTPLDFAAKLCHAKIVKLLLEAGCDKEALAAQYGHEKVEQLLAAN